MQQNLFAQIASQAGPHRDHLLRPVSGAVKKMVEDILELVIGGGGENLFNPWSDVDGNDQEGADARRRDNLRRYLSERLAWAEETGQRPWLLVGEAVGYQGGRFSGIAFTSERLILAGRLGADYETSSRRVEGWSEPSATIVWGTLDTINRIRQEEENHREEADGGPEDDVARRVILWNTVPWHPHRPGEPLTNRTPTSAETKQGLEIVKAVIDIVQPQGVLGIGRIAAETLGAERIRHPAHGGAAQFRTQLQAHLLGR